jgi:copper(I)-binding protein
MGAATPAVPEGAASEKRPHFEHDRATIYFLSLNDRIVATRRQESKSGGQSMSTSEKTRPTLVSSLLAACGVLSCVTAAIARDYAVGDLKIENPWIRADDREALLFLSVENAGDAPDKLVAVRSPRFERVVIHADPNRIVVPHGVIVPSHATVVMAPGRPHVSLHRAAEPPAVGATIELELVFERSGAMKVEASIEAPDAKMANDAEAMSRWKAAQAPKPAPAQTSEGAAPSSPVAAEAAPHNAEVPPPGAQ